MQESFIKFIKDVNSYSEFENLLKTSGLDTKTKGNHWEVYTKAILEVHPDYRHMTKNVWLFDDIPPTIHKMLKIPKIDKGIDGVLETKDGEFYAIQSKFRSDEQKTISWTELSNFPGLSYVAENVKKCIFVTNQDSVCKELQSNKFVLIYGDFFDKLPNHFFENVRKFYKKEEMITEVMKPKPFQDKILMAMYKYFEAATRGILNLTCGGGKTNLGLWQFELGCYKTAVVFVPSLSLLSQTYSEWAKNIKDKTVRFLLIGSDADKEIKEESTGLILTTEKKDILNWIKKNKEEKRVIFCTYQSSQLLCARKHKRKFDFGIFDEAHRTVGQTDSKFTKMLYDENVIIKRRLFMTATPRFYAGDNENITSMDDTEIYGSVIYKYDVADALKEDVLTPYEIMHLYITNDELEGYVVQNKLIELAGEIKESVQLASAIMILKGMIPKRKKDYSFNHVVTYHYRVDRAVAFCKLLKVLAVKMGIKDLAVMMIDGEDSMKTRRKCFNEFNTAERAIMCTSQVLREGVNIPIIDCVCFVDARESVTDIVQCSGRCLRKKHGKEKAYILIPNLLDEDELDSAYKTLWNVVRAMGMVDSTLVDYVKAKTLGTQGGQGGRKFGSKNVIVEVGENIKVNEWIRDIEGKLWKSSDGFDVMYEKTKEWVDKNKRMPKSNSKDTDEVSVANWIQRQRKYYIDKKLSTDKIEKLIQIEKWVWQKKDTFDKMYEQLKTWIVKNERWPSSETGNADEQTLGRWTLTQRRLYKEEKLSTDRINHMNSLKGWFWNNEDALEAKFERMFEDVKEFVKKNKKFPFEKAEDDEEKSLGRWVARQRFYYKHDKLTEEKITKVASLEGWYWNRDEMFNTKFEMLKECMEKNGSKVPSHRGGDTTQNMLGKWATRHRSLYEKGQLEDEKVSAFNTLEGWYWTQEDLFDRKLKELKEFVKKNKEIPKCKSKDVNEQLLGKWAGYQRDCHKKGTLSEIRVKKLISVKYWYWTE